VPHKALKVGASSIAWATEWASSTLIMADPTMVWWATEADTICHKAERNHASSEAQVGSTEAHVAEGVEA